VAGGCPVRGGDMDAEPPAEAVPHAPVAGHLLPLARGRHAERPAGGQSAAGHADRPDGGYRGRVRARTRAYRRAGGGAAPARHQRSPRAGGGRDARQRPRARPQLGPAAGRAGRAGPAAQPNDRTGGRAAPGAFETAAGDGDPVTVGVLGSDTDRERIPAARLVAVTAVQPAAVPEPVPLGGAVASPPSPASPAALRVRRDQPRSLAERDAA
jgi:hypothetical protein